MNENQPRRHLITPIVVFGITALIAVVMLLWALVIWLAQLTGSMIWATLILGGVFALIALIVYLVSVRPAVQYISDSSTTSPKWHRSYARVTTGSPTS